MNYHRGLAQDTGFHYQTTQFYFNKTITGRDSGANW